MAVIARFRDLADAEVASATLEAAGITNCLADAYTVGLVWSYSTALGGIRLHVGEPDLEIAGAVLETTAAIEWPPGTFESPTDRCSVCDSTEVMLDSGPRKTLVLMLITYVPVWLWRSKLRCRTCGTAVVVPLRFRPELVMAGLFVGVVVGLVSALVLLVLGYVMYGRRA